MSVDFSLMDSLAYNGSAFKIVNNKTIGYIAGAALILWNLENNKKDYIWSEREGFQYFSVNHKRGIICTVEYGLNPNINVYFYPKLHPALQLKGLIPLEVLDIDISRDGTKLMIVSGVPNFEIVFYDLILKERISGKELSFPIKQKFIKAAFSPINDNQFFVLYSNSLAFGKLLPSYEALKNEENNTSLLKASRIETTYSPFAENDQENIHVLWDENNYIYLAQKNRLTVLNVDENKEIMSKELNIKPFSLLLTQRHLIICYSNNLIEWIFKYDVNFLTDEERMPFKIDKYYTLEEGTITQFTYDHYFKDILIGTKEGIIYDLPILAESINDEEDEDQGGDKTPSEDEKDKEEKKLDLEIFKFGPFHTSNIIYLKEMQSLDILFSISEDGIVYVWNLIEKNLIQSYHYSTEITKAHISSDDKLLVLGSVQGCIRIIDISDIKNFQVKKIVRIFKNKPISNIEINQEKSLIAGSSQQSKKIFFLTTKPELDYKILGFSVLPDKVNTLTWIESAKSPVPSNLNVVLAAVNYLMVIVIPPNLNTKINNMKFEFDQCPQYGRKIDPDIYNLIVDPINKDIIATGNDKILKKYKQPDELLIKMDLRIKVPGSIPLEELDGHLMPANWLGITPNGNYCVTGSIDGSIIFREAKNLTNTTEIKAHNYKYSGVSCVNFSSNSYIMYSGGNDGSIFLWELYPHDFNKGVNYETNNITDYGVNELNASDDNSIKFYKDVIAEEYNKTQLEIRSKQKKQFKDAVLEIKNKLNQLLRNNKLADDLEKLPRDDFVIDIETRDKILKEGEIKKNELKENAKREIYKQEIIHKRIKEKTWDTMEVQLKAINGLKENYVVYNYNICKRTPEELRKLKMIMEFRRQELKEKIKREEANLKEIIILSNLFKKPENYIVNVVAGQPQYVLNDYEVKEENIEKRKEVGGQGGGFKSQGGPLKKVGMKKINPGAKKEEEKIKEEEEKKKAEDALKQEANNQLLKQKKGPDDLGEWDYIYGAFELFTNNRKRNQIYFIQNAIFKIKQEFNKEFEQLVQFRMTQIESIHEKRKRINEIIADLQKEDEIMDPKKNLLEDPNIILKITEGEIKIEKYLSKEEQERREQERLKEEERIRARMADDSSQRALKDMMGGTLEEKKETALTETIQREEWMNKPADEMNEEEKLKMREYEVKEQKMNEEREKMRKNLENELKNLKNQIEENAYKFDEKLLMVFKRKLEYDQRIYEQELSIIRLVLSMIRQYKSSSILKELEMARQEITEKQEKAKELSMCLEQTRNDLEHQKKTVQENFNNVFENKARGESTKVKNIYNLAFEDTKNEKKRKKMENELLEKQENKKILIKLDPFVEIEKKELKKQRDEIFENYLDEINEKMQNFEEESTKDYILSQLMAKFNLRKEQEKVENEYKDLISFITYFENEYNEIESSYARNIQEHDNSTSFLEKSRSNIEIQIRMKQGYVEIPQEIPVPNLSEAILIPRSIIEERNTEIQKQGYKKTQAMQAIKETKMNVKKAEYDLNLKDLIIKDTELKTKEVQMLRVTKEMQIAFSKQDSKLHNEYELKNLQDQIEKIKQTTEKRCAIYKKKEEKLYKDIQFIKKENDQLKNQGASLMATVKQRKEIHDMMFHKKNNVPSGLPSANNNNTLTVELNEKDKNERDGYDNEAFEKFQQICKNRKLFDEAKRQTEEIELLREELNKLKAKTFANFSNAKRNFV